MRRACGLFVWVMILAMAGEAAAQTRGTCAGAEAEAYLDVNNVRARIFNNGALFWKGDPFVYEVPQDSGRHAIFTSNIWIGGLVGGELRMASTRYYDWQFWPGPLDEHGNPPDDCAPFDHIYEITRDDLIAYAQTGEPTENLQTWPWQLGAPVLDGDGIDGNYDLEAGDRPALIGDQMLWWVMNDVGGEHQFPELFTPPIGMEVHASAFAFLHPRSFIDHTTFYRYTFVYKGSEPLEDAYFGIFSDPDLGNFDNDQVGSDTTLHLGYVYNAINDDGGPLGNGTVPPALGYTLLRTAAAPPNDALDNDRDGIIDEADEMRGLTSFFWTPQDPTTAASYYDIVRGRWWWDGRSITVGGNGRDFSDIPTNFMFPGDPVTQAYWSEQNSDGEGTPIAPSDRWFLMGSGPFSMQPGATEEVLFAIVWSRGNSNLDSIRQLKRDVAQLRILADDILVPDVTSEVPSLPPQPSPVLGFAQNFPNPFRETTTIRYSLPKAVSVRLTVYDMLGREIAILTDRRQEAGVYSIDFEGRGLAPGAYAARFQIDSFSFTKTMMVIR